MFINARLSIIGSFVPIKKSILFVGVKFHWGSWVPLANYDIDN